MLTHLLFFADRSLAEDDEQAVQEVENALFKHHVHVHVIVHVSDWEKPHGALEYEVKVHLLADELGRHVEDVFLATQLVEVAVACKGRKERERERNVLFNDALNTFNLRLYGVRHMVKDHSDSEKGNPLPPHRLLLSINSKGSFICTIPQTGSYIPRPLLHQSWSTGWNEK